MHTMEYCTDDQKNESDLHIATWTDIKTKIWSDKSKRSLKTPLDRISKKPDHLRRIIHFFIDKLMCGLFLFFLIYFFRQMKEYKVLNLT